MSAPRCPLNMASPDRSRARLCADSGVTARFWASDEASDAAKSRGEGPAATQLLHNTSDAAPGHGMWPGLTVPRPTAGHQRGVRDMAVTDGDEGVKRGLILWAVQWD